MKSKILSRITMLMFILAGSALFLASLFYLVIINSTQSNGTIFVPKSVIIPEQEKAILEQGSVGLPIRLEIPKISVDASFEYVGLTADGAMDIPKGPDGVAWFGLGPRPGDIGSAVISGHYGWKNNIPAVFDYLNKLDIGDKIYVETEKGETVAFVVREIRSFGEKDDASDVFYSDDGVAHLNLVTCEGVWNKFSKSYSKRLVVFTDKVIE